MAAAPSRHSREQLLLAPYHRGGRALPFISVQQALFCGWPGEAGHTGEKHGEEHLQGLGFVKESLSVPLWKASSECLSPDATENSHVGCSLHSHAPVGSAADESQV